MTEKSTFKLLSLEEAAELLGVEYRTVYRLVRRGEIQAGRVGRVYRIEENALRAYFERTASQESASKTIPSYRTAAQVQYCNNCGKELLSSLSVAGRCEICGGPICAACWSVKKIQRCEKHENTSTRTDVGTSEESTEQPARLPEVDTKSQVSQTTPQPVTAKPAAEHLPKRAVKNEPEDPGKKIDALRAQGIAVVTYGQAISLRDRMLRSFIQRVERLDYLADQTGHEIRICDARVQFNEVQGTEDKPGDLIQFLIRTGGWGKPKHSVILEARMLWHIDKLQKQHYDEKVIDRDVISKELYQLVQDKSSKPYQDAFRFVMLVCTPGVSDEASALIREVTSMDGFYDKQVLVSLYDASKEEVHYPQDDERYWPYLPIIDPKRWEQSIEDAQTPVKECLEARNSLSLDDAVRRTGQTKPVIREVFKRLAMDGMKLDDIEGIGLVISGS